MNGRRGLTLVAGGAGFVGSHLGRALLDAGERALLLQALRPSPRIRAKAEGFLAAARRPCLAAHVRRTDLQRLAPTGRATLASAMAEGWAVENG